MKNIWNTTTINSHVIFDKKTNYSVFQNGEGNKIPGCKRSLKAGALPSLHRSFPRGLFQPENNPENPKNFSSFG